MDTSGDKIQEYFDSIKAKVDEITLEGLKTSYKEIPNYIEMAKKNGQEALAKKMTKYLRVMVREKILLEKGISKVVHLADIVRYIDNIPNHYVKFCELKFFPRVIPLEVSNKIQDCRNNGLFDEYYILFTDYTEEELLSEEEKQQRKKNKDPIVFGAFKGYDERYYYIADWEDEYCDITLDKFVGKLKEIDKEYKPEEIVENNDIYINNALYALEQEEKAKEEARRASSQRAQEAYDNAFKSIKKSKPSFLVGIINSIFGKK